MPRLPLGQAALRFVFTGALIGSQRLEAVAATRNLLSAGFDQERTIAAIWQGLLRSDWDPARGAWTPEHVRRLVQSVASSPAPPIRPTRRHA